LDVRGPLAADGFFAAKGYRSVDGTLALYHDQGLIPFKMLAFHDGVNATAGLDLVRTSPDHGTAWDLAGRGLADAGSMQSALRTAVEIVKNRRATR
jgi:4-hydroxythreonine-4-phosphate dehydrogenase